MNSIIINKVENRFLPLSESVLQNLEPEPKITDFKKIKTLGTGSFGIVSLVEHKITKVKYAIKQIDKNKKANKDEIPYFKREIEIMYKLHHTNIIKLYGHFEDNNFLYLIMEYMSKGNLYNLISSHKNLSLKFIVSILSNILSSIYYLHNMTPPIIHRDIKAENVLIGENDIIKLSDFGWSNYIYYSGEQRNTYCGTPIYLPPEMILNKGHDERIDIWCFGILMFELLCSSSPFQGKNEEELNNNILKGNIIWSKKIDNDAKDLICKILVTDPNKRIGIKDIITHKFFTKFFPNSISCLVKPDKIYSCEPYVISKDVPWKINNLKKRTKNDNNSNFDIDKIVLKKRINYKNLSPEYNKIYQRNKVNVSYDNINNLYEKDKKNIFQNENEKIKKENLEMKKLIENYKKIIDSQANEIKYLKFQNNNLNNKMEEINKILKRRTGDYNQNKYLKYEEEKKQKMFEKNRSKTPDFKSKKGKNYLSYTNFDEPSSEYEKIQNQILSIGQYSSSNGSVCNSTDDSIKFNATNEIKKIRENEGIRFSNLENRYKKIIEDKDKEINILTYKLNRLEKKSNSNLNKK